MAELSTWQTLLTGGGIGAMAALVTSGFSQWAAAGVARKGRLHEGRLEAHSELLSYMEELKYASSDLFPNWKVEDHLSAWTHLHRLNARVQMLSGDAVAHAADAAVEHVKEAVLPSSLELPSSKWREQILKPTVEAVDRYRRLAAREVQS